MKSIDKLIWFYRIGTIALVLSGLSLSAVAALQPHRSDQSTIVVKFDPDSPRAVVVTPIKPPTSTVRSSPSPTSTKTP
jgi:hypothetical protein